MVPAAPAVKAVRAVVPPEPAPGPAVRGVAIACFVLSGAAGLIAEVCWIRRASLAFGSTLQATSTVLAVFFLGLALGSWVFGSVAARTTRPLRLYARLELALAAGTLLTLPAFALAEALYGSAYRALTGQTAALLLARVVLVAAVLLPPAFLMGGTLPLFCRRFARRSERLGSDVGVLYGLNTLGAAGGCALAGFVLLPSLGLTATLAIGAALSAASGGIVGWLDRAAPPLPEPPPLALEEEEGLTDRTGTIAVVLAIAGFNALGLEVLWTRFLALVIRQTVTTYTLALTVVLAGIVLGSLLASRLADRAGARVWILGVLQAAAGLLTAGLMLQPPAFWHRFGSELGVAFALLLVPGALSGAMFPLAMRMAAGGAVRAPRTVGRLTAINTLGGIAGSLAIGFAIVPRGGMQGALLMLTGLAMAGAWIAATSWDRGLLGWKKLVAALILFAPALLASFVPLTRLPADFLAPRDQLVDFREGRQSNLAVVRRDPRLVLEIDRWWQGEDRKTHQIVAAHLPMLLHSDPRRVLVVGAGAGQTPGRFLLHDPARLDVVDIEPRVFDLIRAHFDSTWMGDPRVRLVPGDGRDLLAHAAGRWDVISLEVGQIFRPGVGAFYTREFYRDVRERLAPGGLVSQFVPLPFLTPETFRRVVGTFRSAFPECQLWFNTSELLLIGGRDSIAAPRWERIRAKPRVHDDLAYAYWGGPAWALNVPGVLAGSFFAGPRGIAEMTAGAAPLTDDRPVLEYSARGAEELEGREIPIVALLRRHLDPLPPGSGPLAERVRALDLGELAAGAWLRRAAAARERGDDEAVIANAGAALRENPENVEAMRLHADALLRTGRLAEAATGFREVIARSPEDGGAHRALAVALHQSGDVTAAIPIYEDAIRLAPDDAEAENNLGAALASRGELARALPHFERAVELRPGYSEARDNVRRVRLALASGSAPTPPR